MFWTKGYDVILCREVLNADIYKTKKKSTQGTAVWERIATLLNGYPCPRFNVDKRGVRGHIRILINQYKKKMRDEEKGVQYNTSWADWINMLEQIMELEQNSELELQEISEEKKDQPEQERKKVENMRPKAMEKNIGNIGGKGRIISVTQIMQRKDNA